MSPAQDNPFPSQCPHHVFLGTRCEECENHWKSLSVTAIAADNPNVATYIAQLKAELDGARLDTARLREARDWIDKTGFYFAGTEHQNVADSALAILKAIDAALANKGATEEGK